MRIDGELQFAPPKVRSGSLVSALGDAVASIGKFGGAGLATSN